mgnify:FL=1
MKTKFSLDFNLRLNPLATSLLINYATVGQVIVSKIACFWARFRMDVHIILLFIDGICHGSTTEFSKFLAFGSCPFHRIYENQADEVQYHSLERDMLSTSKSYILDCGNEIFTWMGRDTSLQDRKAAVLVAQVIN